MSRHHVTLPPIVYTPEPPKPKETKRRRRVGYAQGASAADEAEETDETGVAARVYNAAQPQHSRPVEAVERRNSSTTGKLSEDTLKALLAVQEESGQGAD
ncbi:MAG TPA: hypothetical protein VFB02_17495 [Bradyrhizobium sp.]|nr:hypothetical protein [Bradyrhizobium sp.]